MTAHEVDSGAGIPGVSEIFDRVWRTTLSPPGFTWFDVAPEASWLPEEISRRLRRRMVELAEGLSGVLAARTGRRFVPFSLGRFDQQVSTRFHRDGAPDESLLILGYEPSPVASTFATADCSRAADRQNLSASEFLERCNPLFPHGEAALAADIVELPPIPAGCSRIVVVNNSRASVRPDGRTVLGVVHRGTIPRPDPTRSRVINSMMLVPAPEDSREHAGTAPRWQEFLHSDRLSGPVYAAAQEPPVDFSPAAAPAD